LNKVKNSFSFMKLAYWMYAGPAHIGTLRVASSFKNVHAIMHAPLGDDYFNVMRSMLERERDFTPVTTSIVDRHVLARGSQEKVVENIVRKNKEERPDLILLTPTCTSSILQEDLQNFVNRASSLNDESDCDVILADVNHYRVNELQAADRTLEQIVRFYIEKAKKKFENKELDLSPSPLESPKGKGRTENSNLKNKNFWFEKTKKPSANIIGIFTLGFHNQHDCKELKKLLNDLDIEVNEILPEGGDVNSLKNLPKAWFNIVPYREVGLMTAVYLEKEFKMPYTSIIPIGLVDLGNFIREIASICKKVSEDITKSGELITPDFLLPSNPCCALSSEGYSPSEAVASQGTAAVVSSFGATPARGVARSAAKPNRARQKGQTNLAVVAPKELTYEHLPDQYNNKVVEQKSNLSKILNKNFYENYIDKQTHFISQAAWFSRSIDCQNLTGKKTVVFGDATHAASITKILVREMGINVVCAGTYCKHDADWFREQVSGYCDQILITDDHSQIAEIISKIEPAAIFGTQMERHVGKRLDIPCGVISAPVHIQNFPLGFRPFLGYEGTNQISDLVYNSFSLGMEDHLLEIFNGHDNKEIVTRSYSSETNFHWTKEALTELSNVPGFVRSKVKRNTEKYASSKQINTISVEVMYAAKEAVQA
jgi:light-independent protochlorophyllide reductase subunit B